MNASTWTQRIILTVAVILLLLYMGFQVYRFFDGQYQTEITYMYTVSESAKVNGIVLRDEVLMDDHLTSGVAAYTVSDGTKVSSGTLLAEIYQSQADAENLYQVRTIASQIELLQKAQDPGSTTSAHMDALNRQIFSQLDHLIEEVNSDEIVDVQEYSEKLLLLLNTKQVATGKQSDYRQAIEQLTARQKFYSSKVHGTTNQIKATRPGYFIRETDGFENRFAVSQINTLMPNQLSDLLMRPVEPDNTRVGKLMISHNWYYAANIPIDDAELYRIGREVTLDFHIGGLSPVPATVAYLNEDKESGLAAVVFKSDFINEKVVNLRITQADVTFKSITGLRVSESALRFDGVLQQGVYIIRGESIFFRPVDVIYRAQGFALCQITEPSSADYNTNLQQYDEVITEGTQLYDGKPV